MVTGCNRVKLPIEDCAASGWAAPQELDPNESVHSLPVTAPTTARGRGADIIDRQDIAPGGVALALVLVDDEDAMGRPVEVDGAGDEGVPAVGGFTIGGDLVRGGPADVDDGQPIEMPGLEPGREWGGRTVLASCLWDWRRR